MHEFSLAEYIHEIVAGAALDNGIKRVDEVRLSVGKISGVSVEALRFAWEFVRKNAVETEVSELSIAEPEGSAECDACGYRGSVEHFLRICPQCGALGLRLSGGEEFLVTGISGE